MALENAKEFPKKAMTDMTDKKVLGMPRICFFIVCCQLPDDKATEGEIIFVGGLGCGFVFVVTLLPVGSASRISQFLFGLLGYLGKRGIQFMLTGRDL